MENTRELAVNLLLEIVEQNKYSHLMIRDVLNKYDYMDGRDKAFVKRVTEGTLERMIQVDYVLDQFSKVPVSKMKPFIRTILRMSVYQLLFMDNIPDSAVCNEAVKLAGKRGFRNLQGFVNGVLRSISRKKQEIVWPGQEDKAAFLSVKYSMPMWLTEKFLSERGYETTEKMLESFLLVSPVTIRLKETLKEEEKKLLIERMESSGVKLKKHPYLSYAYSVEGTEGISNLPGFAQGLFAVQDVSSMLAGEVAGIRKDSYVIDVCAAPGGKAMHAAEKMQGSGFVSARDLTEYKAEFILDNKNRMKAENLEVLVWDATKLREEDIEKADVLIADLPCSGLGIIGRKTDIKYHASKESLKQLQSLQREILSVVWQYVKPGGVLVYSTCTVNPEENEENVRWFTKNYPFDRESLTPYLPKVLKEDEEGMLQLLPGIHLTDGFFLARLRRKDRL